MNSGLTPDSEGSDKRFNFNLKGTNNNVIVFESPVDMLSYMSLNQYRDDLEENHFLSLGGVSDLALKQYLSDNKNINEITLSLDGDRAGVQAMEKMEKEFKTLGYKVNREYVGQDKDWNQKLTLEREREEELKQQKQKETQTKGWSR